MNQRTRAMRTLDRVAQRLDVPIETFFDEPVPVADQDLVELNRIFASLTDPHERERMLKVTRSLFCRRQQDGSG